MPLEQRVDLKGLTYEKHLVDSSYSASVGTTKNTAAVYYASEHTGVHLLSSSLNRTMKFMCAVSRTGHMEQHCRQ